MCGRDPRAIQSRMTRPQSKDGMLKSQDRSRTGLGTTSEDWKEEDIGHSEAVGTCTVQCWSRAPWWESCGGSKVEVEVPLSL